MKGALQRGSAVAKLFYYLVSFSLVIIGGKMQ